MPDIKQYQEEFEYMKSIIVDVFDSTIKLEYYSKPIEKEKKTSFDLVTSIDKCIEKELINRIISKYPNDVILSEEFHNDSIITGRTWTIDPIDGTCNMANLIPQFGIQLSFVVNKEIICSSIYTINGELFSAYKGSGAYLNDNLITSNPKELEFCIASFGDFPHSSKEKSDICLATVSALKDKIMKIRFFGAASLDFCYLAAGRTDLVFIYSRKPWDLFPGILLCREAGCSVLGLDGNDYTIDSPGVIASNNKQLVSIVRSTLSSFMN